jgi:hypothetical protein
MNIVYTISFLRMMKTEEQKHMLSDIYHISCLRLSDKPLYYVVFAE